MVLLPSGGLAVHLTSYADVLGLLSDTSTSRSQTNVAGGPTFLPTLVPPELLLNLDVPFHARIRAVVTRDFSASGVQRLRSPLRQIIGDAMAALVASPRPDLFLDTLDHIPVSLTCALLGIPDEDQSYFRPLAKAVQIASFAQVLQLERAFAELYGYLLQLIRADRSRHDDGLIAQFVSARNVSSPPLSDGELVAILLGVLLGADQNVLTLLTKVMYVLLSVDELWRWAARNPAGVPVLVEELIRLIPLGTVSSFPRITTNPIPTSVGLIPTGSAVYADAFQANRDPAIFAQPLHIDLSRNGPRHLQFGYGMHHCMGAALARMEIVSVVRTVTSKLPDVTLAIETADVEWDIGTVLRRPSSLPVNL
jgi:cytochrome P450